MNSPSVPALGLPLPNTPYLRAKVIGSILEFVAVWGEPIPYSDVVIRVMGVVDLPEEDVSLDVICATRILVRMGLLTCNTFDGKMLRINAETMLGIAPALSEWIWPEEDDDNVVKLERPG